MGRNAQSSYLRSFSRRQETRRPSKSTLSHRGGSWLQLSGAPTRHEGYNLKALPRKRLWKEAIKNNNKKRKKRSSQIPIETHRRAITVLTFQKRERGKSIFLTAAFLNCLFLLPFWGEKGGGWWQLHHVKDQRAADMNSYLASLHKGLIIIHK